MEWRKITGFMAGVDCFWSIISLWRTVVISFPSYPNADIDPKDVQKIKLTNEEGLPPNVEIEEHVLFWIFIIAGLCLLVVLFCFFCMFLLEMLKMWSAFNLGRSTEMGVDPEKAKEGALFWRRVHVAWFSFRILGALFGGNGIWILLVMLRGSFIFVVDQYLSEMASGTPPP